MSGKISGIYVEIRGDYKQLKEDLSQAKAIVTQQSKGMSDALNNALSPDQIKKSVDKMVGSLNTLSNASKIANRSFDGIGVNLKQYSTLVGVTEKEFAKLQSRMIQTSAAKAQETALRNVAKAADLSAKEVAQLGKQMGVSAAGIAAVNGASRSASSSLSMLGTAAQAALAYFSVYTVIEFGRAIMDAGLAMDSLQRSFVAVTGSQAGAAETMSFLREEAGRLGQNFYALAPEFKNVMAAARGTAMEGENVRKMLSAIAGASTALGLSVDDTHGTLRALQQMMSKGTIQAEELRGQLGERLPGALNLMAKAMGVSTAELNKMMEDGKLLADEALPKLTIAIEEMYGAAAEKTALESGRAAVNRLSQAWEEFKINLFDNQAFVVAANSIRLLVTAASKAVGEWTIKEQLVAAQDELKGLEQIDGTPMATLPGFQSRLEATRKEVARLKDELLQLEKPATDAFLAMTKGLEQAENRAGDYISYLQGFDQKLEKLLQTDRDKIDATYRELSGKVKDQAALEKWYADEVAKLNEKQTKKHSSELSKQVKDAEKAAKIKAQALKEAAEEAEKAAAQQAQNIEDLEMEMLAQRVKNYEDAANARAKAEKDAADEALKLMQQQEEEAKRIMDRIQEGTADVFYDMFQDIGKGWETLWASMKNWALRTLAELAARAATVQIVVPIMTSMTGTANATQAVQAITGGQGGGFNLSSLSSLVQPGSMLSKVPGMNAVTGLLGATLPGTAAALTGAFSGVGAGAGMYATGLGFAPGAVANGALQGMTLGGQSLATAAPAMTSGLTLGSALGFGALGGLGYSLLGGSLGLPQNQYSGITSSLGGALGAWGGSALASSAAGAALGATAGSVVPIIGTAFGAIGGGLLPSLFGGGKKHSPSVIFPAQDIAWGQTSGYQFHTMDGASWDTGTQIAGALGQVAGTTFGQVEALLNAIGSGYVDQLKDATVTWGRKSGGLWAAWDFGYDHNFEELFAKASEDLKRRIYEAASGAFTAAGQDIASGDDAMGALGMLAEANAAQFRSLQDALAAGVQSGNVEAYIAQLQSFQATVQAITATWGAVNAAADDLVKPPTAYESAVRQANAQFDELVGTLSALGFASAQIEEIEDKRAATLARLNSEMGPLAEAEAARASALADATRAVETAQGNLRAAYKREAAEIEATARKWDSFAESLKKWRDDIMAGSMSPIPASSQADMAASRYADVLNRAKLGDEDAIAELQGVAGQQLTVAKDTAKTAEDYARSALRTLGEVQSVESVATLHADIARQQLEALTSQVEALITINESVLSVVDAIKALEMAQSAAAAAQMAATGIGDSGYRLVGNTLYFPGGGSHSVGGANAAQILKDTYGLVAGGLNGTLIRTRASGGYTSAGLTLVGEEGPELVNFDRPGMVYDASQTEAILSGRSRDATASEVRALREDLRAIGRALAKNTADTAKLMQRWDGDGMPEVRVA